MKYLIDIRDEHELLDVRFVSNNIELFIVNIPGRVIFANKEWIEKKSEESQIFILCRTGNRSSKIKNKYFKNNNNISSIGLDSLKEFDIITIKGKGGFGIQQYIQLIFSIIILGIIISIYLNVPKLYLLIGLLVFLIFIIYQVFSKSCLMSKVIPFHS